MQSNKKIQFDPNFYRAAYEDMADLSDFEVEKHYMYYGIKEGRLCNQSLFELAWKNLEVEPNFNFHEYLFLNPDIPACTELQSRVHFYHFGFNEKREYKLGKIYLQDEHVELFSQILGVEKRIFFPRIDLEFFINFSSLNSREEIFRFSPNENRFIIDLFDRYFNEIPSPYELKKITSIVAYKRKNAVSLTDSILIAFIYSKILSIHGELINSINKDYFQPMGAKKSISKTAFLNLFSESNSILSKVRDSLEELGFFVRGFFNQIHLKFIDKPQVTLICSVFNGGDFILPFLRNMTGLKDFYKAELIFVDANSADGEFEFIQKFQKHYRNIRYFRLEDRVTIYDAWNYGISKASTGYISSTNLDDRRHKNYLRIFLRAIKANPEVSIFYGNMYYSFKPNFHNWRAKKLNIKTELPLISTHNLLEFNSPNCAPIWRKDIHSQIGFFNPAYSVAGDLDFWLRCAKNQLLFGLITQPLIMYFLNPIGLSTRIDTLAIDELHKVRKSHLDLLANDEKVVSKLV